MLGLVVPLFGLVAVGAWIVALVSALSILNLVPSGQKLSAWFQIGWWQFDKIKAVAGPAAEPHIKRYTMAFLTFFGAILASFVVVALTISATQNGSTSGEPTAALRLPIPNSSVLES
jgi:hypothetical protein